MSIRNYWESNFLFLEMIIPAGGVILLALISEYYTGGQFVTKFISADRAVVYSTLAALFGTMLGFVITAVSIILGYSNHDRLEIVRSSEHFHVLWDVFKSAIRVLALATIFALIGLILDKDGYFHNLILYLNLLFVVLAFFRVGRCIWVLERIIAIVTKK